MTQSQIDTPPINIKTPTLIKVSGIAAKVGSIVITNQQLVTQFLADGGQATLTDMILNALIDQEAKKQGVQVTHDEMLRQYEQFKRQMLTQAPPGTTWAQFLSEQTRSDQYALEVLRRRLMLERLMAKAVLPIDLTGKRHLYHILIPTQAIPSHAAVPEADAKAQIQKIAADIAANKIPFKEAARLYSQDDQTKVNGGDLGWIGQHEGLDSEFEKAAFALKEGEVSGPVKSRFGYHLIYAERFGENATLAEKKAAAEENAKNHQGAKDTRAYLQQLKVDYPVVNYLLPGVPIPPPAAPGAPGQIVRPAGQSPTQIHMTPMLAPTPASPAKTKTP